MKEWAPLWVPVTVSLMVGAGIFLGYLSSLPRPPLVVIVHMDQPLLVKLVQ